MYLRIKIVITSRWKGEKNEWLKLFCLSNVITWRGFGKTQIKKRIQKIKERKWRWTKEREGEKEERIRRRRRNSSRG